MTIKTLLEMVQMVDSNPDGWSEIHPAWRAIADLHAHMIGFAHWRPGAQHVPGYAWDWQIALSMIVRGYGADVVRCAEVDGWARYLLPPLQVARCNGDDDLPVDDGLLSAMWAIYMAKHHAGIEVNHASQSL
jgi:hypothetical protein